MKYLLICLSVLFFASLANAADWTTGENETSICKSLNKGGICWQAAIAEDISAINVRNCEKLTLVVYGTGADIDVQTCSDSSCTLAEDLNSTTLTGDLPNTYFTTSVAFEYIRVDWTSGGAAPTISLKCSY